MRVKEVAQSIKKYNYMSQPKKVLLGLKSIGKSDEGERNCSNSKYQKIQLPDSATKILPGLKGIDKSDEGKRGCSICQKKQFRDPNSVKKSDEAERRYSKYQKYNYLIQIAKYAHKLKTC